MLGKMDTSKYNFKKVSSESNSEGTFIQKFYDEDKKVEYNRVTWNTTDLSEDENNAIRYLLSELPKSISRVLGNILKVEIGDSYYETLSFSDDDIEFKSKALLPKIIKPYSDKSLGLLFEGRFDEVSKVYNDLSNDEDFISALKEIYKDYLDKEL